MSLASVGSVVVMSTNVWPGRAAGSNPLPPKYTSRTSAGKPTMVKTISDCSLMARGESTHLAPRSTSDCALAFVRVLTTTGHRFAIKSPHIGPPLTPVPIHTTRGSCWALIVSSRPLVRFLCLSGSLSVYFALFLPTPLVPPSCLRSPCCESAVDGQHVTCDIGRGR